MKRVYISSPHSLGDTEENVNVQHVAFNSLMNIGCYPFAPLFTHYNELIYPKPYKDYINWACEWVIACDALLRLPGKSEGVNAEVSVAESYEVEVLDSAWKLSKYVMENVFNPDTESKSYVENFNLSMIELINLFY